MPTIRRVIVAPGGEVVTEHVEAPVPAPHEVRLRTVLAGVCGSDTHAQAGRHPHIRLPYAPGHEVVGVVESVGAGVTEVAAGDRVVVEPTLPCWDCKQCRIGQENLCENLDFYGCNNPQGGLADLSTVPANRLHRLPDDLDDLTAALVEPLSTPVHAARIAGPLEGKTVAIIGAGTIGLLLLAVVRRYGAARVVVSDPLADKRELALRVGADAVVDATAPDVVEQMRAALGESADVAFDCVAVEPTVRLAVDLARKGGAAVVVGVPSAEISVPLPVIQDEQIRVQGSATYLPHDVEEAIALLQSGLVRTEDFVTGQFPLAQTADAFRAATSGEHIKVVVHP
jgi:threonine dehydrogenase-like Zn-dependent dehydrogenase